MRTDPCCNLRAELEYKNRLLAISFINHHDNHYDIDYGRGRDYGHHWDHHDNCDCHNGVRYNAYLNDRFDMDCCKIRYGSRRW